MVALDSLSPIAQFGIIIAAVFAVTGALMELMAASFHWRFIARHRTRKELPHKVGAGAHRRSVVINSVLSASMFLFTTLLFFDAILFAGAVSIGRVTLEVVGVLVVYDLLYYLLHRWVFHEWRVGHRWHRVHHQIRSPRAKDSLYIHPMETFLGVATMLFSVVVTGIVAGALFGGPAGMHMVSFGIAFFIYSVLNVFIHSAITLPAFPVNLLCALPRNHNVHHASMRGGYYGSITPLWDIVFKTNVESVPRRRPR